jgi:hypothetical protein
MKSLALPLLVPVLALAAAEPASLADAFARGKVSVHARLRFEGVEQSGLLDAEALTLRTRLGFGSAKFAGWQFLVEGENVAALDGDAYSQSGLNPAAGPRAVVADPETTELNQLWAAFSRNATTATVGRQRLVLDHARFVGDVGWRQNQQTFDAVVVQDKTFARTTLTYAYLDQVNRVFSRRHPQGRWDSASHLAHATYAASPAATLQAYAYRLDFDNARTNSCATYGVSLSGVRPLVRDLKVAYRAELARQTDAGSSPLDYETVYHLAEVGVAAKAFGLTLGHEFLGSDGGVGFKTPLATLHAFNGWADLFLATPANGLRDIYVRATATLPGAVALTAFHHWFEAARGGADYGTETDLMVSRKFGKAFTAAAKFADFRREIPTLPEVRKVWLQIEYAY